MTSRENIVIGVAVAAAFVALGVVAILEATVGVPAGWTSLATFLVFAVLGVAVPQIYLAYTDTDVSPTARFGAVLVIFLIVGASTGANATGTERIVIGVVIGATLLLVVAHEIYSGYRSSVEVDNPSRPG